MAALWKATYQRPNCLNDYFYFSAADARSMSKKALRAAVVNAKKRARAKVKLIDKNARLIQVNCVG